MSADIIDISFISPAGSSFAAAGVASGDATSPTIAKTASKRLMNRQKSMTLTSHRIVDLRRRITLQIRHHNEGNDRAIVTYDMVMRTALTGDIPTDETHNHLTAGSAEKNDLIFIWHAAFPSRVILPGTANPTAWAASLTVVVQRLQGHVPRGHIRPLQRYDKRPSQTARRDDSGRREGLSLPRP